MISRSTIIRKKTNHISINKLVKKGDILRSPAGGSNVIFTDMEILRLKTQSNESPSVARRELREAHEQQIVEQQQVESDSVIEQRVNNLIFK